MSYLTDAEKVKSFYGSKDAAALEELYKALQEDFESLDDFFDGSSEGWQPAREILTDIINGEIRFPKLGYMYSYVYEQLCAYFGGQVFPPGEEYSTVYYYEIEKQPTAFIPIPFSNDFPEVYSISKDKLATEKERFLQVQKIDGINDAGLQMEKDDFAFIFDKAIAEQKDLLFMLY